MENLQLSYPSYYLIIIAVVAIVFALGLYFKDGRMKENKSWLPKVLGLLRFMTILGILFLLLMPLLKRFITDEQKPVVVILKDESASIQASTDAATLQSTSTGLESLVNGLSEKFEVSQFSFGENITTSSADTIKPQSTNISAPLEYITETFEDQNLSAIIMTSDGIFNEGKNPLYADLQAAVPIYPIALGDTTIRTDILIKNVLHNRIVYLNDRFLIEADVQAFNSRGSKSNIHLYKIANGKNIKLESQSFTIDKDNFFKSFQFELDADQVGNVKYLISIDGLNNELSKANNSRNIYMEILDARQKILLLAHAPHPDIRAIKQSVKANKNFEIDVVYANDNIPSARPYDMVIMHNLPSQKHRIATFTEELGRTKKPVMYIIGANSSIPDINNLQDAIKITGSNNSLNDVTPILKEEFDLYTLEESIGPELRKYVPLKVPFGDYKVGAASKVLLNQKVGSVETNYPLLAYTDVNNHKQAVLAGEGIWRWRLYEYQEYESYKNSQSILMKSLQYISQKEDKRKFRAYVSKNSFKENESVSFDAQLYNENYEPINVPEATLVITNEKGEQFDYSFSKTNNYYFLDAGRYPEGNYSFKANTNYNGKVLEASGKFSIQSIKKEQYDLTARHDLLNDLAKQSGGQVIYPADISSLENQMLQDNTIKPILYSKAETTPIMNLWWLIAILIILLAVEWFLRRYFGSY